MPRFRQTNHKTRQKAIGYYLTEERGILEFCKSIRKKLSEIVRFSTTPTHHKGTVAEHSYFVTLICWLLCMY